MQQYERVRREAEKLLRESGALGRFPTPVSEVMDAGKVTLAPENVLDDGFLRSMRKRAGNALKSALSKVLGLFDALDRVVFIDRAVKAVKQTFLKLHETAHAVLPWQRDIYAVVEDGEQELDPDVADQFDREANVFATEILFQLDSFITEAADHEFGIRVPLNLSRKYGSSAYAAVRQYVYKNHRDCVVLVLNPPEYSEGDGFRASLRRAVASPSFSAKFDLSWPAWFTPGDEIGAIVPVNGRRMSRPRPITLVDRNRVRHECVAEAFSTPYQTFILVHTIRTLTRTTVVMPESLS
ncbi:MAG: hypothetical protein CMQ43_01550 [Gammaproteobacteria bacterium]|nr:hypothetical protein [Gammaproteobacteria bacterium]|tara:strand:- start:1000 stop:1887 length:888 start_codon:yes stop_codon:yes gene_type:complete